MEKRTWNRQVASEKEIALFPELFTGERILGTVEAGPQDIGLLGFLLQRKERLVVTTHRLLQYSTNFMSVNLKCLELAKVEAIEAGSKFNVAQLVAGLVLLAGAALFLSNAISQRQEKLLFILCGLLSALAGSFASLTAWKKVLLVSGSSLQNSIRLPLARLGISESKSFVELVSGAVRNLSKATMATANQTSRQPEESLKNSRTGGEIHARNSRPTQPLTHPSYREPDEARYESLNGKESIYRRPRMPQQQPLNQPRQERTEASNTHSHDEDYYEYKTSPSGEGWYRTTSKAGRMYIK